jgi:2-enoate reductase
MLKVLGKLGVILELGKSISIESVISLQPDAVLVTSRAIRPQLALNVREGGNIFWADEILNGTCQISGKVVVIGGNNIGCEAAYYLNRQGVKVIVIDDVEKIGYGLEPSTATILVKQLEERGVQFRTGLTLGGIQENRGLCQDKQGHGWVIEADNFVLAQPAHTVTDLADELEKRGLEVYSLPYCGQPGYVLRAVRVGASIAHQV